MKKLQEIAETEIEKEVLQKLVKDIRNFTSDSINILKFFENSNNKKSKVGLEEKTKFLELQKKNLNDFYELFKRMHSIIDYPSYIILDDELEKHYGSKKIK